MMQNCVCGGFPNECAVNMMVCTIDNLDLMKLLTNSIPIRLPQKSSTDMLGISWHREG